MDNEQRLLKEAIYIVWKPSTISCEIFSIVKITFVY